MTAGSIVHTVRVLVATLATLCVATAAVSQASSSMPSPTTPARLRGFSASATVSMRIYVPTGRIRIRTWDRDSIAITGTIGARSEMFGGGDRDHVKLGVEPIRTGDPALASADLLVTVPRRARLWIKATVATIDVQGIAGELEAYAVGGSITVQNASGVISLESLDAPVQVDSVRGDLRIRGGKAPVVVTNTSGTASISSVSGSVTLLGSAAECRIETIGGDISLDATRLRGVLAELQTHAGAIRIDTDTRASPLLELSSRTGRVSAPVPRGLAANGRVVARSFRGSISVTTTTPDTRTPH